MNAAQRWGRWSARRLILAGVPAWGFTVNREGVPRFDETGPDVSTCGYWGGYVGGRAAFPCDRAAGAGTAHGGIGRCARHEGGERGRAEGAWLVAHVIAAELDVDPMHALLLCVRRLAAWSAFYTRKAGEAERDEQLAVGGELRHWLDDAERTTAQLARYSQMAISAGVAAMLVQRAQVEGEQVARALNAALEAVSLSSEQETAMRGALRQALLDIESEAVGGALALTGGGDQMQEG